MKCQSPPHRGTHFYRMKSVFIPASECSVNPLHLGELISTWAIMLQSAKSMTRGVNPLHLGELISTTNGAMFALAPAIVCQSPSPRGTHFYLIVPSLFPHNGKCVNPLHLGELISTLFVSVTRRRKNVCQSPSPRGTHFYPLPYFLLILCGFPASISGVFSRQF